MNTQLWSANNNMVLNTDMTVILNFLIQYHYWYEQLVVLGNNIAILMSKDAVFLGVAVGDHLSFGDNIDTSTSKCHSRLFLFRPFNILVMIVADLKNFYRHKFPHILGTTSLVQPP